ncbi:hypothetical protein QOZ80_7BG0604890 [Eleusine coracana subsp. coracana]|nr:hypothetical protein QOZ80_7BG0604890 [Eleusine coracana subsp. coracana]
MPETNLWRRRPCRTVDWANLTAGPAGLIAEHALANDVADYIRFRATCKAWRAVSPDPRAHEISDRRFHPRHWIVLPSTFNVNRKRCCMNVSTGERIHAGILDLRRHYLFGTTTEGFLVLCQMGTHIVQLLNPITGQVTDLPSAATLLEGQHCWSTADGARRLWLRSAGVSSDNTVALLYNFNGSLAVAKPGQETWTRLNLESNSRILAALPYAGRLYCVTAKNILVVESTSANGWGPRLDVVADYELGRRWLQKDHVYPVFDERGGLILVHHPHVPRDDQFNAYRAKLDTGDMEPVHGLDGQALFIYHCCYKCCSQPVSAEFSSSISPDTVYFRRNYYGLNQPHNVAFDLSSATRYVKNFDKKDITKYLLSYVDS